MSVYKGKLNPSDITNLEKLLSTIADDKILAHKEHLLTDTKVKDQSRRLCFDVLYATDLKDRQSVVIESIYVYANDDHLYTAVKHILTQRGVL